MPLPLSSNAKLPKVITEVNALGVLIVGFRAELTKLKSLVTEIESDNIDIRTRITALEEKLAALTPCPDPEIPEPPPGPEPPDLPDETPDPPTVPDLFLVAGPVNLAFGAHAGAGSPGNKQVQLFKSGTGTLQTPQVVGSTDTNNIVQNTSVVVVDVNTWHLVVGVQSGKPAGVYSATIRVKSPNQTNDELVFTVTYTVIAVPIPLTLNLAITPLAVSVDEGQDAIVANVGLTQGGEGILATPTAGAPSQAWLSVVITGTAPAWNAQISFNTDALAAGNHSATVAFSSTNATNNPRTLTVNLTVTAAGAGVQTTYRGSNLPVGITCSALQSLGDRTTLATPFGGTVWDTTDLVVGSARYNASTVLTVSATGAAGLAELIAHLATVAANDLDYRILLPVGTMFGTTWILPAKSFPGRHCWIVNTTVNNATFGTPIGTKVPASTTGMSIIQGPAASRTLLIDFADSGQARGYSFHGCVIQNDQSSAAYAVTAGLIWMHRDTGAPANINDLPGRLGIDRCWLRGSSNTDVRRAVLANGPYFQIQDSRISEIHQVGFESAGIGGWTGSRFHNHVNLTIEAASQFILYGGADPHSPQSGLFDPSDIYTERVYGFKPLRWLKTHPSYDGSNWLVKTGFEAKNVSRWLIDRSWTQNNWPHGQSGHSMLFQNLSDQESNHLQNRNDDIIIRNHRFDYCAQGLVLAARASYATPPVEPTHPLARFVFDNVLMTRIGGNRADNPSIIANNLGGGGLGWVFKLYGDLDGITLDRITSDCIDSGRLFAFGFPGARGSFTNFVSRGGLYGAHLDGDGLGSSAIANMFTGGLVVDGNVVYDLTDGVLNAPAWDANESNASMVFQDYANYDYRLTTQHLTKGVGGSQPGCDIDTLDTLLAGINT